MCPLNAYYRALPQILRNKMVEYVKNERIILDRLDYEGIIKLSFTFQDSDSLCECGCVNSIGLATVSPGAAKFQAAGVYRYCMQPF